MSIPATLAILLLALVQVRSAWAIETVRIKMGEVSREVSLSAKTLWFGPDSEEESFSSLVKATSGVRQVGGRLEVNGMPWEGDSVRFRTTAQWLEKPEAEPEEIGISTFRVRGDVVVRRAHGQLELINVLPLEDYVAGVLGQEMPVAFPLEALKAQAVAARTYALKKKLDSPGQPYHLGSSVLHQVYGGLRQQDARVRAAVEATRGEILTYDLEPIEAYFHSSCGGHTESGSSALGRSLPYLKPVDCPCGRHGGTHWELSISRSELAELAKSVGQKDAMGLTVEGHSATGRAKAIRIDPDHVVDAVTFRQRLGYSKLKSLWFEVESTRGGFRIKGRGYGHGAGMCQWGAKAYADGGTGYREILQHYYADTELQRLY